MNPSATFQAPRRRARNAASRQSERKSFAPLKSPAADTWEALARDVKEAWITFDAWARVTDCVVLGREPTDEEQAAYDEANNTFEAAIRRALDYRPRTTAELLSKADLFDGPIGHGIEEVRLEALTADLKHLFV